MTGEGKAGPGQPEAEPLDIELDGIEREFSGGLAADVFSVGFRCAGAPGEVHATVEVPADTPTSEIMPRAMCDLHRLFAALAAQTRAWLKSRT